jgi:hypothetical protein
MFLYVTLPVLRTITNNFSQERKLGQGTFGQVYLVLHFTLHTIALTSKIYDNIIS